jgi:hypothetical protein
MVRNIVFALSLIFFLGLALAHPYGYNMGSVDSDYYWASDYYHTSDFDSVSSKTYKFNSYNKGYEYDDFESYKWDLFKKYNLPGYGYDGMGYRSGDVNGRVRVRDDLRFRDDENSIDSRSRVYEENSDYYVYHSRTFGKSYLKKCDSDGGRFFYIKCGK